MCLFPLGRVVATPAALESLEAVSQSPQQILRRHAAGDWGDLSIDDKEANSKAITNGSRIFSAYTLSTEVKLWVITEAANESGKRASTCILLPDEY